MTRSIIVALFVVLLLPVMSRAQPFVVESSLPASGSTSVPLTTTIRFEFNDDVSTQTNWNTAFVHEPRDAIAVKKTNLLLDDEGRTAVVEYEVEHTSSTDVTWLVYAIENADGKRMTTPYVLPYTTADDIGARQVSGTLTEPTPASPSLATPSDASPRQHLSPTPSRTTWQRVTAMTRGSGLGHPVFEEMNQPETKAAKSETPPDVTSIFLLEHFAAPEEDWDVHRGTVIEGSTGDFSITHVRDGTYWPIAVRYADWNRAEIESIGFHDPDGDGAPDPVTLSGADRTGIDLVRYPFPLTTAQGNRAEADAAADTYAPDQTLVHVEGGNGSRPDGTAYAWTYRYASQAKNWATRVTIDPIGTDVSIAPCASSELPVCEMEAIAEAAVDSEAALEAVLADGGQDFIEPYSLRTLTTHVEGGNLFWWADEPITNTFWRIQLLASTSTGTASFERFVDMETGKILPNDQLPVELTGFTARVDGGTNVVLEWQTASEANNAGFDVEQMLPGHSTFEPIAFVEGAGTTNEEQRYRYRVADVQPGTHCFRLRQIDVDGGATYSPDVEARIALSEPLTLEPVYPNPFVEQATVRFGAAQEGRVTVELFDAVGRRVRILFDGHVAPGQMQTLQVEGRGLASGRYFLRLQSPAGVRMQPLTLAR